MTTWTLRPLSVGEILDTTVGVYRKAFVPLLLMTIVTQGLPVFWEFYATARSDVSEGFPIVATRWMLSLVLGAVGSAASTFIVSEVYVGGNLTMMEAFQRAVPFIGRILGTGVLTSLVSFLGLIFLIVPGVIAFCGFLLATPALVLEGLPGGAEAMSRAWRLSSGLRGRIFVVLFVGVLLLVVPIAAIGALSAMFAPGGGIVSMTLVFLLVTSILQLLTLPYFYVATTVLYYDAKVRKEGLDLDVLAKSLLPA